MTVWIDTDLCSSCGHCVTDCPYDAIVLNSGDLIITNRCTECGSCIETCKTKAITVEHLEKHVPDLNNYTGVWVFVEHTHNGIRTVSIEILSKAQSLAAALDQKVTALILGFRISNSVNLLESLGADKILAIDDKILKDYDAKAYATLLEKIVKAKQPNIFLFGATHIGRDLAPRLAKLIGAGLTADCTDLEIDSKEKTLIQIRPAFGGNVLATIVNRFSRPQMATVRPGVMAIDRLRKKRTTTSDYLPCTIKDVSTKIVKTIIENDRTQIELGKAKTIVAGGRGMGNSKHFNLLYDLAFLIGGEVAGTRVAVENGWISEEKQIGQTGQTVRPYLYIACGISGAIQHRAGMMNAKFVVAINSDPYAAIFKVSTWGIIGDISEVLPKLIEHAEAMSIKKPL